MGRLSDEEMVQIRAKNAARREKAAKRGNPDPLFAELKRNVTHYEVHVFHDGAGPRKVSEHATEQEARDARAALGKTARALVYMAGRLPSRGPDQVGVYPLSEGDY